VLPPPPTTTEALRTERSEMKARVEAGALNVLRAVVGGGGRHNFFGLSLSSIFAPQREIPTSCKIHRVHPILPICPIRPICPIPPLNPFSSISAIQPFSFFFPHHRPARRRSRIFMITAGLFPQDRFAKPGKH